MAIKHARIQTNDDVVDAAITYAEQLAQRVDARIIDTDLWIQALIYVARRNDLPHHYQTRDAS